MTFKLSKQQMRLLRRAQHCVSAPEVDRNGNQRRTYQSLIKHGYLVWDGVAERFMPSEKGRAALNFREPLS